MPNELRMSFGEWLFRMSEADVAPQARTLAIYAAVFDVTGNDELARLSGLGDEKAMRTYDKWKKDLLKGGWVLISRRQGGRGIGIDVHAALGETPVAFTDVIKRNPSKFYPRNNQQRGAENTPVTPETPVKSAGVGKESFPHTPFKEKTTSPRSTVEINNLGHQQSASDAKRIDPHDLYARLTDAANGALSPIAIGLQVMSEPIGWIEHGADLDKDILPVVKALSHKVRPQSIKSWNYYAAAVSDAKDNRLRGLPAPTEPKGVADAHRMINAIVGRRS